MAGGGGPMTLVLLKTFTTFEIAPEPFVMKNKGSEKFAGFPFFCLADSQKGSYDLLYYGHLDFAISHGQIGSYGQGYWIFVIERDFVRVLRTYRKIQPPF